MAVKVACVQSDVVFGDPEANAAVAVSHLGALKAQGVELVVFPEAFLTGYCVGSYEDAMAIAVPIENDTEPLPAPSVAAEYDVVVVL